MTKHLTLAILLVVAHGTGTLGAQGGVASAPGRHRIEVKSSVDGTLQPSYLYLPAKLASPAPLAVMLHTWSFDLEQRDSTVEEEANKRGWILLAPNFRGANNHPEACGSRVARQDILDVVAWVRSHYQVDARRIYLLGLSGGGYMTMLMASRQPGPWAAASAWVGISDLGAWYAAHSDDNYGAMMRGCFGGGPGDGERIAAEYRDRSPRSFLTPHSRVALDLAAGRFDSTVAVSHTLRAFQLIAPGVVTNAEIDALLRLGPGLPSPHAADTATDASLGRRIFLRRTSGRNRVTIFDGGHEWEPHAAVAWLAQQHRP